MLLPSRKPSSSYSLLKFVYVTSQLRHSLVVHPLLRKILDPPLNYVGNSLSSRRLIIVYDYQVTTFCQRNVYSRCRNDIKLIALLV